MCKDLAPARTGGRSMHGTLKPQPCAALSAFDGYCPVHLKARGYTRCALCSSWRSHADRRPCADPAGDGWRPMVCAPRGGQEITVKNAAGLERRAHWCAFVEDHPPIEPGFYFWTGTYNDLIRDPIGWRPSDPPLDARAIGDEELRRRS